MPIKEKIALAAIILWLALAACFIVDALMNQPKAEEHRGCFYEDFHRYKECPTNDD
jgi:hypothetical protein